jgi:recombination protein RecA
VGRLEDLINDQDLKDLCKHLKAPNLIQRASEAQPLDVPCISTDNFELDAALGGGLRYGRVHTFYGPVSSGKTYSALKTMAAFQHCCSRCCKHDDECTCAEGPREATILYILTEDWDRKWAEACGVDTDRLLVSNATYGEEGLDTADVMLRSGKLDLVVIDSLAFLSPEKEIQESVAANHVGLSARMIGQFVRKCMSGFRKVERTLGEHPTLLLINQIRMDVSIIFGNPETKPGGKAPEFAASTETRFSRVKVTVDRKLKIPTIGEGKFKVMKNKNFCPHRSGEFRIVFQSGEYQKRGDLEDEHRMLAQAKRLELMVREGNKWTILGREFPKQEEVIVAWQTDPLFKRESRAALIKLMTVV